MALRALAGAAAVSLWLSALPHGLAGLLALIALGYGLALAHRHRATPATSLVLGGEGESTLIAQSGMAVALHSTCLHWRGPLLFVSARDPRGQRRHWVWLPDTLPLAERRRLRRWLRQRRQPFQQLLPLMAN